MMVAVSAHRETTDMDGTITPTYETPAPSRGLSRMSITVRDVQRLAAFHDAGTGGNPAGVALTERMPDERTMRRLAAEIGYSETAFAHPEGDAWRVRYFSPESEVPFCGHATIALGAALAAREGDGTFRLRLNEADITVEGRAGGERDERDERDERGQRGRRGPGASLLSPPTSSVAADPALVEAALALFGYAPRELDPALPPLVACAGATHLILALRERGSLAAMRYELGAGRALMDGAGLVTIALVHARGPHAWDARNAFASGGVIEDPATGAAAAALAGALRDRGLAGGDPVTIVQGEDMGARSVIVAEASGGVGEPVRVSGAVRRL